MLNLNIKGGDKMSVFVVSKHADNKFIQLLKTIGDVILLSENEFLNKQESCHPDMQIFKTATDQCIIAPGVSENALKELNNYKIQVLTSDEELSPAYPENVKFNVLKAGKHLFHNTKYTSSHIKSYALKNNLNFIDVKQGYCACSSLYIPFCNLIISGDNGIINAAKANNYSVCIFEHSKEITLKGYDHGFIGGCAAVIENGKHILFNGDVSMYPDFYEALLSYGIKVSFIKDKPLEDVGGAICFK